MKTEKSTTGVGSAEEQNEQLRPLAVTGSATIEYEDEYILCAAVWYKEIPVKKVIPFQSTNPKNCPTGLVFSGHRHVHCIYTKCAITGLKDCESGENEQGFLTNKNRFVSREEAAKIAIASGQIIKTQWGKRLFSEDLY